MHTFPKTNGAGTCDKPAQYVLQDGRSMMIYCSDGHTIKEREFDTERRAMQAVDRQAQVLTRVTADG